LLVCCGGGEADAGLFLTKTIATFGAILTEYFSEIKATLFTSLGIWCPYKYVLRSKFLTYCIIAGISALKRRTEIWLAFQIIMQIEYLFLDYMVYLSDAVLTKT
jgi:hypothetical protein